MTRITKRVVAGASVAALFVAVGAFVAVTRNHSASPLRQRLGGGTGTRFVASRATVPSAVANLPPGFIERNELDPGAVRHLGPFPTKRGPLDLYVIPRLDRSKSFVLVLDAKGGGGGGCATDLSHGHAVAWTEGSQGGPEATAVTERYIAGFAKPGV